MSFCPRDSVLLKLNVEFLSPLGYWPESGPPSEIRGSEAQFSFIFVGLTMRLCLFPLTGRVLTGGVIPSSTKHADSIDLELEVDPLNVDHFSCTPLVRNGFLYPLHRFSGAARGLPGAL